MKRFLTIALTAASLALIPLPAKAQYMTGDLMMGFETGGIKDVILSLGPAQMYVTATAPFAINIGNLNSALIAAFGSSPGTNANILTAVFGNVNPSDVNQNTLYASRIHSNAISGSGQSSISSLMSSVESQYNNDFATAMTRAIVQDSTQEPNTYLSKVTGGRVFNNFITEAQFSTASFILDRIPPTTGTGGGPGLTTTLGTITFAFDGGGNVTGAMFAPVPEPSTYALGIVGAGTLLLLAKRRAKSAASA